MENIFISKIHINKVRHLENVDILLSETERKHLILTGKNGSGKTSLLESLGIFLTKVKEYGFTYNDTFIENRYKATQPALFGGNINGRIAQEYHEFSKIVENKSVNCFFSGYDGFQKLGELKDPLSFSLLGKRFIPDHLFLVAAFDSHRQSEFDIPNGPFKTENSSHFVSISQNLSKLFLQYLVNLRYERLDALEKNDYYKLEKIRNWFDLFENVLRDLFDDEKLILEYDHEKYSYKIIQTGRNPITFNEMPSGYSAVMRIIAELVFRMKNENLSTDLQGIVLIDEIETHLHIDLQKKILPFLTSFFPKIQFIVTTHSPFVLSSVDNAVIFDLETKQRVEDLSGYSVEGIVESYFDVDQYSEEIKAKLDEYETLLNKSNLTNEEKERKLDLKIYFKDNIAKTLSPELSLRIKELETQKLVIQ